jgi:processive 1,2-diacylglycerol beta-glucosyltransferase
MRKEKILILYGSYGEGHQQAAKAIRDSFLKKQPHVEVIISDFMELSHPLFYPISQYLYIQGLKKLPSAYGYLYDKTRSFNGFSLFLKKFNRFGMGRLLKLIQTLNPSVVVSTFPMASGTMSMLKSYGLTNVPTTTVITDHTDHSYWIYPLTDHYIVGSEIVKHALLKYNIPDQKITVTGIPIRTEFSEYVDREKITKKHGLDPGIPTVLLMGGGYGLFGHNNSLLKALDALPMRIQLIFVCGNNDKLQLQLTEQLACSKHRVHIYGYIDHIHELMGVSHFMVGKPGGLTISEALAMELPMIIFNPLPGQEEDNTKFLVQSGVAFQAKVIQDLTNILVEWLQHPEILKPIREKARKVQKKWAAFDARDIIWKTRFNPKIEMNSKQLIPIPAVLILLKQGIP